MLFLNSTKQLFICLSWIGCQQFRVARPVTVRHICNVHCSYQWRQWSSNPETELAASSWGWLTCSSQNNGRRHSNNDNGDLTVGNRQNAKTASRGILIEMASESTCHVVGLQPSWCCNPPWRHHLCRPHLWWTQAEDATAECRSGICAIHSIIFEI